MPALLPLKNPPNPWLSTEVQYLEDPPDAPKPRKAAVRRVTVS